MRKHWNLRLLIACIPWVLPVYLFLPYATIVSSFRGIRWAWETADIPFWAMLFFLLLMAAVSSFFLARLNALGLAFFRVGAGAAFVQVSWLAMSERRHLLLVLIFLMLISAVLLSEKISRVLRLPYLNSRRHWWESYPKGIPGLSVELFSENGDNSKARVSNFGVEGCFVFSIEGATSFAPAAIRISAGERVLLETEVVPEIRTKDGFGWGLRFPESETEGDWTKDLEDHLGFLRRSGYEVA